MRKDEYYVADAPFALETDEKKSTTPLDFEGIAPQWQGDDETQVTAENATSQLNSRRARPRSRTRSK
jgi:hypothetical protein